MPTEGTRARAVLDRMRVQPGCMLGTNPNKVAFTIEEMRIIRLLHVFTAQWNSEVISLTVEHVALATSGLETAKHAVEIWLLIWELLNLSEPNQMDAALFPGPRDRHGRVRSTDPEPSARKHCKQKGTAEQGVAPPLAN